MVPSIARQSVIIKCNMQKSVMLGNYEFYYAAGLVKKLYGLPLQKSEGAEELLSAILEKKDSLTPQSAQETYLLGMLGNYEALPEHDAQMEELFVWGEQEPDLWKPATSFSPKAST